jgi:Major Facilitator Superfamily
MYGCQKGSKCPLVHVKQDQAHPLHSSYAVRQVGQVPSGVLADRVGGSRVICGGLALWSLVGLATPLARLAAAPMAALCCARAVLGLAQATAPPSVSAVTARSWAGARGFVHLSVCRHGAHAGAYAKPSPSPRVPCCLSVRLSVRPSSCPSARPSIHSSALPSVQPASVHLSIHHPSGRLRAPTQPLNCHHRCPPIDPSRQWRECSLSECR